MQRHAGRAKGQFERVGPWPKNGRKQRQQEPETPEACADEAHDLPRAAHDESARRPEGDQGDDDPHE